MRGTYTSRPKPMTCNKRIGNTTRSQPRPKLMIQMECSARIREQARGRSKKVERRMTLGSERMGTTSRMESAPKSPLNPTATRGETEY